MQLFQHRKRVSEWEREDAANERLPTSYHCWTLHYVYSCTQYIFLRCCMRSDFIRARTTGPEHYPHSFRPKVILTDSDCVSPCKYLRNESMRILERIFLSVQFSFVVCFLHFYIWYVSTHLWFTMRSIQWHKKGNGSLQKYEFLSQNDDDVENIFDQIRRSFARWCVWVYVHESFKWMKICSVLVS